MTLGTGLAIMLLLRRFFDFDGVALEAFIDTSVLTAVLSPVLYFLIFRRIMTVNSALKASRKALRRAQGELERKVAERTRELTQTRQELESSLAVLRRNHARLQSLGEASRLLRAYSDLQEVAMVEKASTTHSDSRRAVWYWRPLAGILQPVYEGTTVRTATVGRNS